ncbi:MAG: hypothetical protein V6Z81_07600 [Parvularculales bacterium]
MKTLTTLTLVFVMAFAFGGLPAHAGDAQDEFDCFFNPWHDACLDANGNRRGWDY